MKAKHIKCLTLKKILHWFGEEVKTASGSKYEGNQ